MRNVLLGFMMVLMFTPVLVCAMAFCPMSSAQASEIPSSDMPCHQSDDGEGGPMLALDCMGIDLFQQGAGVDFQPDQSIDKADVPWAISADGHRFLSARTNSIRGPPGWADQRQSQRPILLLTQRFRL